MKPRALLGLAAALALIGAAPPGMDPKNPTCPKEPGWGALTPMKFRTQTQGGSRILIAEGMIDDDLIPRLKAQLDKGVDEIWLRSPGGNAKVGNEAGLMIRKAGLIVTRIPAGWGCFSACNFLFMGGRARIIDPGGLFIVHMFTHTGDRDVIREEVARGTENTVGLIAEIEQGSAILASEDNDFLIRMGVSRKLLTDIMYRQSAVASAGDGSTRRCLTREEAYLYKVANVREAG
jgi:hypothetical protein